MVREEKKQHCEGMCQVFDSSVFWQVYLFFNAMLTYLLKICNNLLIFFSTDCVEFALLVI